MLRQNSLIPADIWRHTFGFFNKKELKNLASVCKSFQSLIDTKLIANAPYPPLDYSHFLAEKSTLKKYNCGICCVKLNKQGDVFIGMSDGSILLLDEIAAFKKRVTLSQSPIRDITFLPNDDIVLASGKDVLVCDSKTFQCKRKLSQHTATIQALNITKDGDIISGAVDKAIHIWDDKGCKQSLYSGNGAVLAMAINGSKLLSASQDRKIREWDLTNYSYVREISSHHGPVNRIIRAVNGDIISGSEDGLIIIWDQDLKIKKKLQLDNMIFTLSVMPNNDILTVFSNKHMAIIDSETGHVKTLFPHLDEAYLPIVDAVVLKTGDILTVSMQGAVNIMRFAYAQANRNEIKNCPNNIQATP